MSAALWFRLTEDEKQSLLEPMRERLAVCERSLIAIKRLQAHHHYHCVHWSPDDAHSRQWHYEQVNQAREQASSIGREARALKALLDFAGAV